MSVTPKLDDLVQSVSLYTRIPTIFHLYLLPFLLLYSVWMYLWIGLWGFSEHYEGGFVGIAAIACVQILANLACYWSVHIKCFFSCKKEKDPLKATIAKVVPTANNGSSEIVWINKIQLPDQDQMIYFIFQKTKYVWDDNKKTFKGVEFPIHKSYAEYNTWKGFQEDADAKQAEVIYSKNDMDMVVPEFSELFTERATAPFFVFQVFCVGLWCLDKYWYYSIFTLVMLVLFECTLVQQQLRNMAEIRKMGNKPYNILVYRNRRWRTMPTDELIPGDIISIVRCQKDNLIPCDVLLLRGSCIVDESMLTGESVPQMKEAIETCDPIKILDPDVDGKFHVLFGGTKVVQHTSPSKSTSGLRPPDNGCVAYVLRTGFNTSQGKLLRTILFGVKRVTANNKEIFGFILFLLIFAIAAAAYVWKKGVEDPERNRYNLFLECTLILTSVIPPELPIELSLAVNTSMLALSKLGVFCTEPFRIPFAGKVDICCFDKTGTLTSDNLVVEGVALAVNDSTVTPIQEVPTETVQVLACCHSLAQLDDGLVGDPLEKATITAAEWTVTKADCVIPKKGKLPGLKIFVRHHFSSQLKRMSVIAGYNPQGSTDTVYISAVKGAPETLRSMFAQRPEKYDEVYLELSRRGARVLALGFKEIGKLSSQELRDLSRESIESELKFAGFVIISCPLKTHSKSAIKEIQNASHKVVMITGDNPLTACHVAVELQFTSKPILILSENEKSDFVWESIRSTVKLPIDHKVTDLTSNYDLCVTGDSIKHLKSNYAENFVKLLPFITVFARFAPKQKELVITQLKALGFTTLMCGDGTNDVGALKHAEVGVAILANAPERLPDQREERRKLEAREAERRREERDRVARGPRANNIRNVIEQRDRLQSRVNRMMKELEEEDQLQIVKLGDASIASPFTSKLSSITCICHIIKQGRCTLVTTLQMFKILALNALILAYTQSVLYLDGIKLRDMQATLQGFLLAASFLFISRSKPLKTLSTQRPLPNIFNFYTISTVLLQFSVHFISLIYLVQIAKARTPLEETKVNSTGASAPLTEEEEYELFKPNLINSTVFVISLALQLSTFAINYRGNPYMESLKENRYLLGSILISSGVVLVLTLGIMPELSAQFEIIDFPDDFKYVLILVLFADFFSSYLMDRICLWICGEGKMKTS
ncbi:endoplasmic reticulum transmembrane helix translocase [Dendroctonus ponderosae]|uniref:Endoplasmic reticulum transmembrane helix translocase n=1 Tax=Dendroctonus ponderosae TaxID=77166 RepID=A0AAR5PFI4_DENPD|nr:endoplasmic reticulum transmembrane helix translocase [Dendroctonus ponderosae]